MSPKDKDKKKKRPFDDDSDYPFDIFSDDFDFEDFFDKFFPFVRGSSFGKMIDDMIRQLMKSFGENFDKSKITDFMTQPFIYGFQIGIDPDGKPVIRQFGNVKPKGHGNIEAKDVREPLIDVFKEKDKVRVIAEVPGVGKGDIKLTGTENSLTIRAHSNQRKYEKTINLPVPVKIKTAKARYNNGVLEVTIERKELGEDEGVEINVQ